MWLDKATDATTMCLIFLAPSLPYKWTNAALHFQAKKGVEKVFSAIYKHSLLDFPLS